MLEAELAASGEEKWVVAVLVGAAVAAAVKDEGVVEQIAVAFRSFPKPGEEARQVLGEELVEPADVFRRGRCGRATDRSCRSGRW